MATQEVILPDLANDPAKREQEIRARISSLSYLPTTVAVALKFIDLGKNPNAEPSDYAKVISADSSLSSKLLALSNSSWFGVRNKVTSVKMAVNLLGLGTVRTLAISYCMAGLHNELRLSHEESHMFWEATLCKALAAKQYARIVCEKVADEAFACGLFEDFAIPVMYATAKKQMLGILRDVATDCQIRLRKERDLFRLDHTEIGRIVAQKLELPESFVDAVAFHHSYENLGEFFDNEVVRDAVYASSLFPHLLEAWNPQDIRELRAFLVERTGRQDCTLETFLASVQEAFDKLYKYFDEDEPSETRLADLLERTAKEAADNTTQLVENVNELMQQAATMSKEMHQILNQRSVLEDKALRDPLTEVMNREGFMIQAEELLTKAARYRLGFALAYFDIDKFKQVNDRLGHQHGDIVLEVTASHLKDSVRAHDAVGRLGGDEFVLFLNNCAKQDAEKIVRRIVSRVGDQPVQSRKHTIDITVSAGLLWVAPSNNPWQLDVLIHETDVLMYQAKKKGGNQICTRTI